MVGISNSLSTLNDDSFSRVDDVDSLDVLLPLTDTRDGTDDVR